MSLYNANSSYAYHKNPKVYHFSLFSGNFSRHIDEHWLQYYYKREILIVKAVEEGRHVQYIISG